MMNNEWRNKLHVLQQRFYSDKPKSYEQIIDTFRELVMIKDFEKLTVAEISTSAGISRKTFYQYFKDKNDIVEHIVYQNIIRPMTHMRNLSTSFEFPSLTIISWIYEQLYEDRLFYKKISSFTGQNSFFELILNHTSDMIAEKIVSLELSDQEKEYSIYFYASSHTMVIIKWINDGMEISPKEMASFYEKWTIPAIMSYFTNQM